MLPFSVVLLLLCATPLPTTVALPFEQKGLLDYGKSINVEGLVMMLMNDEEEGSAVEEYYKPEQPTCPFGCQCNQNVVQCSDLGG